MERSDARTFEDSRVCPHEPWTHVCMAIHAELIPES